MRFLLPPLLFSLSLLAAGPRDHVLAGVPLSFEPNAGQAAPEVLYIARASGQTVYFTAAGILFQVHGSRAAAAVRMKFAGGSKLAPQGEARLTGRVHYLNASVPGVRGGLPTYSVLRCRNIYPGVDAVFYGSERKLEYDLVLSPGADLSKLRLVFAGADSVNVGAAGDLVIATSAGEIRQHKPVAYQRDAAGRTNVEAAYALDGPGQVGFRVAGYDKSRELVIDPVVSFATFLGGNGQDDGRAIAVDAQGNIYVAGTTRSPNFPATAGSVRSSYTAGQTPGDIFVTKFASDGVTVRYSTFLGGTRTDVATAIAVDSAGAVYLGGYTDSLDFPVTAGAFQSINRSSGTYPEGFVVKLSPDGSTLSYSTYLGQTFSDRVNAIAVDSAGSAFVAGSTDSNNFPSTPGAFRSTTCTGYGLHAFVVKMNAAGSSPVYSALVCGSANDEALAIAVDLQGNAYVAGSTTSKDFPVTGNPVRGQISGDGNEAFVTKMNSSGTALLYSTYLGGTAPDVATGIAVDSVGNAYVTGYTRSADFPTTPGAFQTRHGDNGLFEDAFVAVLNPAGSILTQSTYLGGSGKDLAAGIAIDSGAIYLTGSTTSSDFPGTRASCQPSYAGKQDAFVLKLNLSATALVYSESLGGWEDDRGEAIVIDRGGNAYVTGQTASRNFTTTPGAYRNAYSAGYGGSSDAFVARVDDRAPAAAPCVALNGIVSGASFLPGPLSPGLIVSVFGEGLGPAQPVGFTVGPSGILGKALAGTRVLFDGDAAPIIATSTGQVNAIVPYEVAGKQSVKVQVEYQGNRTSEITVPVAAAQASIFTQNSSGQGAGAILNQDYSLNTPANPAAKGSIIQIYATGEGQTSPAGVSGKVATSVYPQPQLGVVALIGGIQANIHYAGAAPTLVAGVIQVNVQVPPDAPSGRAVPVVLLIGENESPSGVTVAIQ